MSKKRIKQSPNKELAVAACIKSGGVTCALKNLKCRKKIINQNYEFNWKIRETSKMLWLNKFEIYLFKQLGLIK